MKVHKNMWRHWGVGNQLGSMSRFSFPACDGEQIGLKDFGVLVTSQY